MARPPSARPPGPRLSVCTDENPHRVHGVVAMGALLTPLRMLGHNQSRDSHIHGAPPVRAEPAASPSHRQEPSPPPTATMLRNTTTTAPSCSTWLVRRFLPTEQYGYGYGMFETIRRRDRCDGGSPELTTDFATGPSSRTCRPPARPQETRRLCTSQVRRKLRLFGRTDGKAGGGSEGPTSFGAS